MLNDLTTKKITYPQFVAKSGKLKSELMKSKVTRAVLSCSVMNCSPELRAVLTSIGKVIEYDCATEKQESDCEKMKTVQKILKKNTITVGDYLTVLGFV